MPWPGHPSTPPIRSFPTPPLESEASWQAPAPPTAAERLGVRLEVVSLGGAPAALPLQVSHGRMRAALPSRAHGVRLTNASEGRVFLVVAIDGVNPTTGQRAYMGQPGMVLEPGQSRVLSRAKAHRKAGWGPVLAASGEGLVSVAVFPERTDYPLVLPDMESPPFGPDTYRVGADGVRRWVPPQGYPFRKASTAPSTTLHILYAAPPAVASDTGAASAPAAAR